MTEVQATAEMIRLAFTTRMTMVLLLESRNLAASGIPESVLALFPDALMLKLDRDYLSFQNPTYDDDGIEMTLSFDDLVRVRIPWSAILSFQCMTPAGEARLTSSPSAPKAEASRETPSPTRSRPSHLKLVSEGGDEED